MFSMPVLPGKIESKKQDALGSKLNCKVERLKSAVATPGDDSRFETNCNCGWRFFVVKFHAQYFICREGGQIRPHLHTRKISDVFLITIPPP